MKRALLLLGLIVNPPAIAETPPELAATVDKLVQPYVDAVLVNAISIGIVQGDQQWSKHYGQLSEKQTRPPADDTIYEIGSITKVFTGILLADAVVSGQVKLNQPIGEFLPEVAEQNTPVANSIQLRHLSTHVSGLPRMPSNMRPADATNPHADYGREQMIEFVCKLKPRRQPEKASEYSNLAVGLLGQILSIQAGQSYAELLSQKIAEPLTMDQTDVRINEDQQDRLAPPHDASLESVKCWDFDAFVGAGGIRSDTTDMMQFIRANLKPEDTEIGRAIELAWAQQMAPVGDSFAMGLGWHIARDGATRWHNGQTGGYHSMMLVDRRINAGVVLLCNTATTEVDALAESIIRAVAGIDVQPRSFEPPVAVDPKIVSRLAGDYAIAPTFVLTMRADGDKLYVQATGQPEARVFPKSKTKWRYRVVDAQLTFDLPDEGPAKTVTLHQNGRDIPGPRVQQE